MGSKDHVKALEADVEKAGLPKIVVKDEMSDGGTKTDEVKEKSLSKELSGAKLWITTGALCSIVATALPVIAQEFGSTAAYTWVGSAYLLATAASIPNWGKTSDIFGRKPMIFAAAICFLIGSIMCSVAKSIGVLIAGRAIAGAGGGGVQILAMICVSDIVPLRSRSLHLGNISMVWALATSFGPVLGGVFTTKATWRWCFWVNLPIGGVALVALYFFLHVETPKISLMEGLRRIDWSGTFLMVPGTVLFLFGLEIGGVVKPWDSPLVLCCLIFGVVLWVLFLVNERYIPKHPIMPLLLFKNRSNLAVLGVCLFHGFVAIAGPFYLPLYFQAVLGATPIMSGVFLLPYNTLLSVGSLGTSWITNKTGRFKPIILGAMMITALGYGLLINLPQTAGWAKIVLYTMIAGFGIGPNYVSPLIAFQSETAEEHAATGIGACAFVRTTAASASIVVGGTIFQNAMQRYSSVLQASLGNELAQDLSGSSAEANIGLINTLTADQQALVRGAFLSSLSNIWIFYTVTAGVALIIGLAIRDNRISKNKEEIVAET